MTVSAELTGFATNRTSFQFNQQSQQVDLVMNVSGVHENVTVQAESPMVNTQTAERSQTFTPSENVQTCSGGPRACLPVRVDVPRAGSSLRFVKPLVVDQEAVVSFRYKRR